MTKANRCAIYQKKVTSGAFDQTIAYQLWQGIMSTFYYHLFDTLNNTVVMLFSFLGLIYILKKAIRRSNVWHATVTPLASIIGSGFLVAGPVLVMLLGNWSVLGMVVIVLISYQLGAVMRFNILNVEPQFEKNYKHKKKTFSWWFDSISRPVLAIAYLISVTFYLKLLSAFALSWSVIDSEFTENILTTILLIAIGITGYFRGLSMLEKYEMYAVSFKLAIIFGLLAGLFSYNFGLVMADKWVLIPQNQNFNWESFQKLLGLLIIVQGFETSRYLGYTYTANLRNYTMKVAQRIAIVVYIVFIMLSLIIFDKLTEIKETSIIDMSGVVSVVLPVFLVFAAITSQFSASVADTIGSGGLIREATRQRITTNTAYFIICIACIFLTWVVNIYEVITFASKAFALYYALQTAAALVTLKQQKPMQVWRFIWYASLLILMVMVVVFSVPVE